MDDTPPRRSRRPPDTRKEATFPLVPFLIGVVVLGFVIGAGLSMAGHRGSSGRVASVPIATPEPTQAPPTFAPLATARPRPAATDRTATESPVPETPSPAASVSMRPSTKPSAHASPARVALASLPPSPAASAFAHASASPTAATAAPTGAATSTPVHTHAPTSAPKTPAAEVATKAAAPSVTPLQPAAPTEKATIAAPNGTVDADSDFGRLSANVVKQYLRALARGDSESAAGAFAPGSNPSFPERPIMDSSAQIGTITARGAGDMQTVNVSISTSNGNYVGTYTVHRTSTGAAVIASHSINKG